MSLKKKTFLAIESIRTATELSSIPVPENYD